MEDAKISKDVAEQVQKVIETEALQQATLQFGKTRVLFSKGRTLGEALPPMEEPPEYPDVPTKLKDDKGSWLK